MPDFTAHVALGESLTPIGQLRFTQAGPRQFSTFSYDPAWIENPRGFAVQPSSYDVCPAGIWFSL
jgi:serine/threonine-protein kinase HipA